MTDLPEPYNAVRPPVLGTAGLRSMSRISAATIDLRDGLLGWPQWFTLGNFEVRLRFRRTLLGPFWNTLSFGLLIAAIGFVYGRVLGEGARSYLPYLALGLLVWSFIASTLQEACLALTDAASVLKQVYLPRSVFIYRTLWRNLLVLCFNGVAVAVVLAVFGSVSPLGALTAFAGLGLVTINLAWIVLLLALVSTRLRLVSRLVQTVLPIAMLATPVIWRPSSAGLLTLAQWNPAFWAIELIRSPLLGVPIRLPVYTIGIAVAAAGCAAALAVFSLARPHVTYWL